MKQIIDIINFFFFISVVCLFFVYGCNKDDGNEQIIEVVEVEYGLVADVERNEYKTIRIDEQEWMAENLRTTKYYDGKNIPNLIDNNEWNSTSEGAYVWYKNNIENKAIYGALYNWYAVSTDKLCPEGWRVPDDNDWKILEGTIDSRYDVDEPEWNKLEYRGYDVGEKLKAISGWHNNGNGTDDFGFTALPGGYRYYYGSFYFIGKGGRWWSSSSYSGRLATSRYLPYDSDKIIRLNSYKKYGLSVRCIKE